MTDLPPPPRRHDRIGPAPAGAWPGAGPTAPIGEHPDGTTVLVLGILSIAVCGVLGPFAWRRGTTVLREMDANPERLWTNRGNVIAGRTCGIIGSVFLMIGVTLAALWILVAVILFANIGN